MTNTAALDAMKALNVSAEIKSILAGRKPEIQGAILADLVAIYFAGHRPDLREDAIRMWTDTMRALIALSEKQLFEKYKVLNWDQLHATEAIATDLKTKTDGEKK